MPRLHQYDQHFLRDPNLVFELIGHSDIKPTDTVYDFGAGSGVISMALAARSKSVVAVEIEKETFNKLRENTTGISNITLIQQDLLKVQLPDHPYKVFSNIPFSLSAQVLRRLTQATVPPDSMYLIVQKQFGRKVVPSNTNFTSQLGAQLGPWWQSKIRRPLQRTDFTPPPNVDTVLLELKLREEPMLERQYQQEYQEFVEICFSRQKYFGSLARERVGISPEKKPSELTIAQWCNLYLHVKKPRTKRQ